VAAQLAAAQAQLVAAAATSVTSDNAEAQASVVTAQTAVTAATALVGAAQAAAPLAAQAVVDHTALNVGMQTSNVETLVGSLADDVFTAEAHELNGDRINGRAGNDTLVIAGEHSNGATVTLTSVETIRVDGPTPASPFMATLNVAGATGLTTLHLVDRVTATLQNTPNLVNLVVEAADGLAGSPQSTAFINYDAAVVAGAATAQNISLSNVNAQVNTTAGIETLNITATGTNTLTGSVGINATTITVTGTGSVNLNGVTATAATNINAASLAGGVSVTGGANAMSVTGGQGNDVIQGGSGNDTINGGTGNDTITGGAGDNVMDGGEGHDTIDALTGNNIIYGRAGNDTITLGAGFDFVEGGEGNDTIIALNRLDGLDVVRGGSGFDTLEISGVANEVFLQSVSGVEQFHFTSALNTTNYKMFLAPMTGMTNFLSTGSLNDTFDATAGGFTAGLTFRMGGGTDNLKGGSGSDTFIFSGSELTSDDTIDGGLGNNTLMLDNGLASVNSIIFLDRLSAVSTINVGSAAGLSAASAENVTLTILGTEATEQVITVNAALMQDGRDALDLTANGAPSTTDFSVIGGAGNDAITTGFGDDTINGGAGNDTIIAGGGANVVDGGNGEDVITVTAASTVDGGAGRDHITGSSGSDVLSGGAGGDILSGGAGGNDTLSGGADSDIFIVNSSTPSSIVTISDFNAAQDRIIIRDLGGIDVAFVGTANSFANAQTAISVGSRNAVYQSDNNTLWIDTNNDGTLNANDTRIILTGVTSLTAANVSAESASLPDLSNTLLNIADAMSLYGSLPNSVYIVKDTAANISAALNVGGGSPSAADLASRALTANTLAQSLEIRFDSNPTPQQLLAVAALTTAPLIYSGISAATPADLLLLAGTPFAQPATNVSLTDPASLAEIQAVDAAWGTVTLTTVRDTAAALNTDADTNSGAGTYVRGSVSVEVTDTATLAQLANIDGNITGTPSYSSVTGTAATFFTNTAGTLTANAATYVTSGKNVTVTDTVTMAQLASIDTANGNGTLTYSSITDAAATLDTNAGSYVTGSVDVTVNTAASLLQLANIDADTTGTISYTTVTDTALSFANAQGVLTANATTYVTSGKNVNVTTSASLAQLVNIDAANGVEVDGPDQDSVLDWTFSYAGVTDTAANIASSAGVLTSAAQTYVTGSQTVSITTNVNVAQIDAIDLATSGLITFGAIEDTAANLVSSDDLDGAGSVTGENHNVVITGTATAAQFNTIQSANGNGTVQVAEVFATTSADVVNLSTQVVGTQSFVYTNGLQAATAVFANVSDSTQLMTGDTFTVAGTDILTLGSGDKIDLSEFNLSGEALVTDLTVNGTTIRDGSWMLVQGTFAGSTFTTGGSANHTLLLWDGNQSGGVGAVNMQGVVIVGTGFSSADLTLLA
jgi:Ca2+-binding RTX toxin-like protein